MWLSPDGTDWAWAREEALRCLSRLGGWDRTVLKSHLRPLKRSLDSRPPTSGVWQSLQRAKVFTWSHHKGTRIGLWPSFEGRVNQSQSRLVVNLDGKFVPSINDSLSCSFLFWWLVLSTTRCPLTVGMEIRARQPRTGKREGMLGGMAPPPSCIWCNSTFRSDY